MNPDLETILLADDEARARVEAARRSSETRVAAAREEAVRSARELARARQADVEKMLASIGEQAEKQAAERRRRREEYLVGVRLAAQMRLAAAADAWARLIRDGPSGNVP